MRTETLCQLLDLGNPFVATLFDDVGRSVLARQTLSWLVAAHGDDPLGAELLRREHGEQADGAVADHCNVLARPDLGGHSTEPAGPEHIGCREQARDEVVRRYVRRGHERAVGERYPQQLGLRAESAHRDAVHARTLVPGPADLAGVVRGPERADDELAGLDRHHLAADLF